MGGNAVVIAGAGATGLVLAGELALAGVDAVVLERRPDQGVAGPRARGLHARSLEIFDQRGIAGRLLAEGKPMQIAGFAGAPLDISDFPTRHPYGLALLQVHVERILAGWVAELGVRVRYGVEVTGFAQDDAGVDVALSDGTTVRAAYLVGCDGGRSLVRKAAGIAFPGAEPTTSNLLGEVELTAEPPWGIRRDAIGIHGLTRLDDGRVSVLVTEPTVGSAAEPTLDELRAALVAAYGTDFGAHSPTWLTRFTDGARQAARYRDRRVLLAGDAAHVHPPDGGHGLNTGVQDAVNLGWKLARVARGTAPESLLDTYHSERHPVGARVLRYTLASVAMRRADERTTALREVLVDLLGADDARKRLAAGMTGLDIRYDLGDGHPLLGRRMPDLDLVLDGATARLSTFLHDARPVLLDLGALDLDVAPWGARRVAARCDGPWELPVVGAVPAPSAVLVRPDGHVAWVGDGTADGLADALTRWLGPPAG